MTNRNASRRRSPLTFFVLVFALSSPFWWLGAAVDVQVLPGIPVSSLMVLSPLIAAVILVHREDGRTGLTELLNRSVDYERVKAKERYAPVVLLMPGVMVLSYGVMRVMGSPIPAPQFPVLAPLILFFALFIAALSEEVGWSATWLTLSKIDRVRFKQHPPECGMALWHVVPLAQVHRSPGWIAWHGLNLVSRRVLLVWLYNNTGKSVFVAAPFHAMMNVSWRLFPINGTKVGA